MTLTVAPDGAKTEGQKAVPKPRRRGRKEEHLTPAERHEEGRAARRAVPRASHGAWEAQAGRPDPVDLLEQQAAARVPELVPIRYGRMTTSPFAFYRGAAAIMASDLASTPQSGFRVQLCGDAHISNFGGFASAERDLIFDLNDFDETLPGPWEWDVKRLAASIAVAGRELGFASSERRKIVRTAVGRYREVVRSLATEGHLAVWYARLDVEELIARERSTAGAKERRVARKSVKKAHTKDSMRALNKLTRMVDGEVRIASNPPLLVPVEELFPADRLDEAVATIEGQLSSYARTLPQERRQLFEQFNFTHFARKVVGVGSVGTRAFVLLMLGRDQADPLFLQVKEASESVLEPYVGRGAYSNQGQRVVEGQRVMQASSDVLLGWVRAQGVDGVARDYYVRQLWDWKISGTIETMSPTGMAIYAKACGGTLARAHCRVGDRMGIAAYLGSGNQFDRAMVEFAEAYAEQNERDYNALIAAIKTGRVQAQEGI